MSTPARRRATLLSAALLLFAPVVMAQSARDQLQALGQRFWQWRATEQPFTNDLSVEPRRPAGFTARWSVQDAASYRARIGAFEREWRAIDLTAAPVAVQVDHRLLGSAIARVVWELEVVPEWKRNPFFYVDQSFGAAGLLLAHPAPFSAEQQREIVRLIEDTPHQLADAHANLTDMRRPYVVLAVERLTAIEGNAEALRAAVHAAGIFAADELPRFDVAVSSAATALASYREWLQTRVDTVERETALRPEGYQFYLRNIALVPYTPEQISSLAEEQMTHASAAEAILGHSPSLSANASETNTLPWLVPLAFLHLHAQPPVTSDNPDAIRRHFYDTQTSDALLAWKEETLLLAGKMDQPNKRAFYADQRNRAIYDLADVRLAVNEWTLDQGTSYIQKALRVEAATARHAAMQIAVTPSLAISPDLGWEDLERLLADAAQRQGEGFDQEKLRAFVTANRNVPLSLLRWEFLGDKAKVPPVPPTLYWPAR